MATNRLQVTELDFDTIKTNLKNFLKSQSEFQDYDFEGSGLNVLIDLLAYNTHYNAYYTNMVANEAFLDTAQLRDSVVSHAKTLGYIPYSRRAPRAIVNLEVDATGSEDTVLTVPRGFSFKSDLLDNVIYNYVIIDDVSVTKLNDTFTFENVEIYQGNLVNFSYNYNESSNPKSVFTIDDFTVDTTTIRVTVRQSQTNTTTEIYTLASDVLNINDTSAIFFLQESNNGKFQIYFGDGVLGKKINDGSVVTISYLTTDGPASNKISGFSASSDVGTYTSFVTTVVSASAGGTERETLESIKYGAKFQYSTQNRLVTTTDYETYIIKNYPNIESLSIWGGEEETPKIYGKVFLSLKPKEGYYLSELEKQKIIDEIINPKSIVSVSAQIRDPEYLYLLFDAQVKYDKKKTLKSPESMVTLIRNTIISYRNENLNQFKASFVLSKLQENVDSSEPSISGNDIAVRLQKRFAPILNQKVSYVVDFANPLHRGTAVNKLKSSEFTVNDSSNTLRTVMLEEVPQSYTGISSIEVLNPGQLYTSIPTVTITGDGNGATATAKIVNGKIQSIEITNRGYDYSRAVVTITGGGGIDGSAVATIDAKTGTLRTVYFDSSAKRQIVNSNVGNVNYDTGKVTLNDIEVVSVSTTDGLIRIDVESEDGIIESFKNTIVTMDETDSASMSISLIS